MNGKDQKRPDPNDSATQDTLSSQGQSVHTTTVNRGVPAPPRAFKAAFQPGEMLAGRYKVLRFIAHGGMGEVYEVEDQELRERVALKTIRAGLTEQPGALPRFKREIQLARKVAHPNVCRTFDIGHHRLGEGEQVEDVVFMTMELLEGETLSQRLKRKGRMTAAEALPIVQQMAAALATAHAAGIAHRDFKPSNVVLSPTSGGERAVVTDFGLARAPAGEGGESLTGSQEVLGTPDYMAPEQVVDGKTAGPAADIYALGVVIYEMLTGALPFVAETPLSRMFKRVREKPVPPRQAAAGIDAAWEAVILRCLEQAPGERFASATDVARALGGEAVARSPRSRRRLIAGGALGLLLAVGAGYLVSRAAHGPSAARSPGPSAAAPGERAAAPASLKRAVAVLGFKNLGRAEAAWLSTAMSEMLRTELAAGGKVRTIAGESVARMKLELALGDEDSLARDSLAKVGANLGADLVVVGSYLTVSGGKLRLDMRLQDTAAGEVVAASSAEGTEQELFRLVSEAGAQLREGLGIGLVSATDRGAIQGSFPAGALAGQLYSEGLSRLRAFDALQARTLLEKAAAADPGHPLIRAELARAFTALGYDEKAQLEAKRAFDLAKDLPREDRLAVQALYYETTGDWEKAVETRKALLVFFPERLDYGLDLAAAQVSAGQGQAALATLAELRMLPPPLSLDPRLDLAEATAAKALTDSLGQRKAAQHAAEKASRQGARLLYAQARLSEGTALVNLGQLQEGRKLCEEAGEIFAATGDQGSVARSQNIIAVAYAMNGDFADAKGRFEEALKAFRRIGDERGIALQLNNVAGALVDLGKHTEALRLYNEALSVSRNVGDKSGVARALNNLGSVLEETNQLDAAVKAFQEALDAFQKLGQTRNVALATANIGEVLHRQGKLAAARERYQDSLSLSRKIAAKEDTAVTLGLLAKVLVDEGSLDGARRALEEALALQRENGDRAAEGLTLSSLADLAERSGDAPGARDLRAQAEKARKDAQSQR